MDRLHHSKVTIPKRTFVGEQAVLTTLLEPRNAADAGKALTFSQAFGHVRTFFQGKRDHQARIEAERRAAAEGKPTSRPDSSSSMRGGVDLRT